jgi:hypothetical protein
MMNKLVISLDGQVVSEVAIANERTALGRRPYNDIVIDNLAVSGEHALLHRVGADVYIEDLNSTNGTYINGKAIKKQLLVDGDNIDIGKYKIRFLQELSPDHERTAVLRPATSASSFDPAAAEHAVPAAIKVLTGLAAGRELVLTKAVTTFGKPGAQVAAITKRPGGYAIAHLEGNERPLVNGIPLTGEALPLKSGDLIDLAGARVQFIQA